MDAPPARDPVQMSSYIREDEQTGLPHSKLSMTTTNTNTYWCHLCALPQADCMCGSLLHDSVSWQNYQSSPLTPVSPIKLWSGSHPEQQWSTTAPTTMISTNVLNNSPSPMDVMQQAFKWPAAPTSAPVSTVPHHVDSSVITKLSSVPTTRDEAKEKRLQQNRKSQQSFRHRQARLVEDLKTKVDELQRENEELIRVISSFGDASEVVKDKFGRKRRNP